MPLLKKRSFEKRAMPDYLRDDEEVFYCEITNEIFRDYDEFAERMLLCNSMVWTCSMTGKSNLTYSEALESEMNAKKSLKEFAPELRVPILYLASKTNRTSFGDMADDVNVYVKDRYFVGENLECLVGNKWKESRIIQVIAPTEEQIKDSKSEGNNLGPPANLYKYEVEYSHDGDKDSSEMLIVDMSQMRRKKTVFNKEKCKLFLKQYVEQDKNGVFRIKQSVLDEFSINKLKFNQIFDGPLPVFDTSKRIKDRDSSSGSKTAVNGKKNVKQETMAKYLTKDGKKNGENGIKEKKNNNLLEQMKKREEEFKLKKQQKEEEKLAMKQKKKEDNLKFAQLLKEWYKPKEDLELEDQLKLPAMIPVKIKIPDKYVGDMLMILEFVNSFSKLLQTKSFFPNGFTLEVAEKALTENHVAGPLIDLIQMLLSALFIVQARESNEYRTEIEHFTEKKDEVVSENINLHEGTRLATLASTWSSKYQGLPLGRLPLYSLTVSEVLRLHLLSSGARINEVGAKWRYAQRGGYTSEDDPGLYFRLHHPDILKALAVHNVVQLSMGDKIKVINCLIDQLLTYADVRDVIEERLEKTRQFRQDHKTAQTAERKREQEYGTAKFKIKKENKDDANAMNAALDKLQIDNDRKKMDNERAIAKIMKSLSAYQVDLGYDRAYRKYLKLESVPGLFINHEEEHPGVCLNECIKQIPDLANANREQTMDYIRKNLDEINSQVSSDKENEPKSSNNSPTKKINGVRKSLQQDNYYNDLLICSANPATCIVHNVSTSKRIKWSFVQDDIQLNELINNLNKRGIREGELMQMLKMDKESLERLIAQTPISQLNPDYFNKDVNNRENEGNKRFKKTVKNEDDSNLGYPMDMKPEEVLHNALIDNILEMEEKIFAGNLGKLNVNRDEWRDCLLNRNYKNLDRTIVKKQQLKIKSEKLEKSRSNTPEIPNADFKPDLGIYQDPGRYLSIKESDCMNSSSSLNELDLEQSSEMAEAIEALSIALCQVAYSVEPKYLKKPLGKADLGKNDKKKDEYDVLDRWAQSLMSATSFSQVFLHYGTLDSCVMWSRSVLRARCRTCRRQNDSENMLLCDSCNLGHHLYCLKPKLTTVPEGEWFCDKCQREKEQQEMLLSPQPKKKRRIFRVEEEEEDEEEEEENESTNEEDSDEDYCSDVDMSPKNEVCKACSSGGELICCEKCSNCYHIECTTPPLRRAPRGSWICHSCKNIRESDSEEEEFVCHKKNRRDETRDDLPLHNVALQEVLADVMKHPDAWPFLRPVQKNEVPDYYDVITKPMDFGTIKYKLNMGEYNEDWQLMKDVILVFENCNTYNHTEAEVYKCGVRLLKYFQKKCKALNLRVPEELQMDDDCNEPKGKKARLK